MRRFRLRDAARRWLRRLLRRDPPRDPYAYVRQPLKHRPGGRSGAVALDEPDR